MLGKVLGGRYKVVSVLGSGGFGHTYVVEDMQRPGHPRCVLKHLTFASSNSTVLQQVRRLFQTEAETLEKLGRHDQIPQLLAYFEENQEFYLVQELIEGRSLSDELASGIRYSESQVMAVLEDVLSILEFVHAQGVIHRDLKPENLIRRQLDDRFVLIDFGAVKTISKTVAEATGETNLSMPVYTSGYAASEQCMGRPQFSSDLYALGMVAIQLLTGLHPSQLPQNFHTSELIWRDQVQVSDQLAAVLDQMTRYHYLHRYQSAAEALSALRQIIAGAPTVLTPPILQTRQNGLSQAQTQVSNRPSARRLSSVQMAIAGLGVTTVAILAVGMVVRNGMQSLLPKTLPSSSLSSKAAQATLSDRISAGEQLLNQWQPNSNKQAGVEQIAAGNYASAVIALEAARKNDPGDPEILIYLNNARISTALSYKIAVVAPLKDTFGSAQEILRGIAQAQDEVNRAGGIQGKRIQIVIANDDNRKEIAQQIAKTLVDDSEILGVVGHGISDTTLAAAEVYQQHQLVMVSPLSSAVQLSNAGDYIFRTMPSDRLTAKKLADYTLNRLKKRDIAVFFNSASAYSTSLKDEFKNALFYNGVNLKQEIDFARPDFDPADSVEQAITKGAKVLMLASDNSSAAQAFQVIQVNRKRLPLLAGDSLATAKVLKVAGPDAAGVILAVPTTLTGTPFQQRASQIWGKNAAITWRTALAYDATQAILMALQQQPTRSGIQRILAQPNFAAAGANGTVSFQASGDRQGEVHLITVAPIVKGKQTVYIFKPL